MGVCSFSPIPIASPSHASRVLVCDDQPGVRQALMLMLKGAGYVAEDVDSPHALLDAALHHNYDLILADLNYTRDTTSGKEGLDLLAALQAQGHHPPVIVMTAWGSIELAVEAMQRGACGFIQKPWDNAQALDTIRKHTHSARQHASEMESAAVVQRRLLPSSAPQLAAIDYAGRCLAARGIGGDYYDFLDLGEGKTAFLLGDVSGKGVSAALLMANLQACFHSRSADELSHPAQLLSLINRHFYNSTDPDRFTTLFYGVYDDTTRYLRYVNCGHCPPLLTRASGEIEMLEPTATVLGAFEEWECRETDVTLFPEDTLLLYSDGVTDAVNEHGDPFGEHRLVPLMSPRCTALKLIDRVIGAVSKFENGARSDDVTVVALRAT